MMEEMLKIDSRSRPVGIWVSAPRTAWGMKSGFAGIVRFETMSGAMDLR